MTKAEKTETATKKKPAPKKRSKKVPVVLAHWKGFRSFEDAKSFLERLSAYHGERKLLLALPLHHLEKLSSEIYGPSITLGSSSMADCSEGAFTAPIAGDIVKDAGGHFVLIGDADARQYLHEKDDAIRAKIKKCLSDGLSPMLAIGETVMEHHEKATESVLKKQLETGLSELTTKEQAGVTIVYDTCWDLRFDSDSTSANFEEAYKQVRTLLEEVVGTTTAKKVKVFIALPPYFDDLSEIPKAKVDGFYMSKASVMPQALATIAPPDAFIALPAMQPAVNEPPSETAAGMTETAGTTSGVTTEATPGKRRKGAAAAISDAAGIGSQAATGAAAKEASVSVAAEAVPASALNEGAAVETSEETPGEHAGETTEEGGEDSATGPEPHQVDNLSGYYEEK